MTQFLSLREQNFWSFRLVLRFSCNVYLILFCILFTSSQWMGAQTSFGRISGTVSDSSGAVVPGAKVTIRNVDTQVERVATTDEQGFYLAVNLPIGTYNIEINQQGFRPQQQTNIVVVADARVTVDFTLTVGSTSQSVEIIANAGEGLNSVSGELSKVIDTKQVTNLPLNGHNYIQLMTMVPGATVTNPDQFSVTTSLASNNQTINGNRSDTNNLTVDGAYNQAAGSNTSLINNVSPEFIQEVKLQTSNFSAEYGRMSGPAFNIVTKNGTNVFHGSAFEYLRNNYVDARNYFAKTIPPLRFNDFGYSFGGPIIKNRLFFFGGQQWKRLRQNQTPQLQTLPDSFMLSGDFHELSTPIYYPGTKTPIPGNKLSNAGLSISPDGQAIANVYRLMAKQAAAFSDTPTANNLTLSPSNPLDFREDLIRIDYNINPNHLLYGRWCHDDNKLIDPFGTFSGSNLPTTPTQRMRPGQSIVVAETWIISSHLVNEARVNGSWVSQHIPPYGTTWQRSTYGFQFQTLYGGAEYPNGIPQVAITNYAGFIGPNFALKSPTTDIQIADTISYTVGKHSIRAGGVYIRDRIDQNGRPAFTGNVSFNASGNPQSTGYAFADALLGNFKSYTEASADPTGFFRFTQPEAFVTDTWKTTTRLSLELGLRYQYMEALYTQANNMANFVPALYDPAKAVTVTPGNVVIVGNGNRYNGLVRAGSGVPKSEEFRVPGSTTNPLFQQIPTGARRGLYSPSHEFGPRLGFAYTAMDKTVVRGGVGVFYNRPEGNITFSQVNLPPFLQISEYDNANLSNITGGSPGSAPIGSISAIDPNLKTSRITQYSLGVQQELPSNVLMELSYVGNVGRHLLRQPNINYPDLAKVAANPSSTTNAFVPYLGFTSIQQYKTDANSNYNALQLYLSRNVGSVTGTLGYTWSKALADASGQGDNSENFTVRRYNYGETSFDRRHAFFANFVWQLPALRGYNAVVRNVLGGWQSNGVIRLQTGQYYTVTANTATGTRRADYNGQPVSISNRTTKKWFNTSAFTAAPAGRFGTAGVGSVEGPALRSVDLSVAKHFPIGERVDTKFELEAFNVFNITNFSTLNMTQSNSSFGTISAAYPPRNLQATFKVSF